MNDLSVMTYMLCLQNALMESQSRPWH